MKLISSIGFFMIAALVSCARAEMPTSSVKTVAFPGSAWDHTNLSVCWELASAGTESYRTKLKEVLTESFKETVVAFSGWNSCAAAGNADVRIFIYDDADSYETEAYADIIAELRKEKLGMFESSISPVTSKPVASEPTNAELSLGHPRTKGYGKQNQGKRANLILNRTFKDGAPGFDALAAKFSDEGREFLALSVAIHEMGHVLGLMHEDAHPDVACPDFKEEPHPEFVVTPYNPFSIMSRCFYRSYNYDLGYIRPNIKDIEGINKFYAQSSIGK